jgi:WD40 repeat protein
MGSHNGAVVVDVSASAPQVRYFTPGGYARTGGISPDGRLVAAGTRAGTVHLWDANGTLIHQVDVGGEPRDLTFDATGENLAVATQMSNLTLNHPPSVAVIDPATGRIRWQQKPPGGGLYAVAFHPHGKVLASGGNDGVIRFWDKATGQPGHVLRGHEYYVNDLAFLPDGSQLLSCDLVRKLCRWDAASTAAECTLVRTETPASRLIPDPKGRWLAILPVIWSPIREPRSLTGYLYRFGNPPSLARLPDHTDGLICGAASPDGQRLAIGLRDGRIVIWDVEREVQERVLEAHVMFTGPLASVRQGVLSVNFTPDRRTLLSVGIDRQMAWWNVETGERLRAFRIPDERGWQGFACDPKGQWGVIPHKNGVDVVDLATGKTVRTLEPRVNPPFFSPDGRWLGGVTTEDGVALWEFATGKLVFRGQANIGNISDYLVMPDGRRLFTAGKDGAVKLWDIATGQEVRTLVGSSVALLPDGQRVVTGSEDGTVRLYDARPLTPSLRKDINSLFGGLPGAAAP